MMRRLAAAVLVPAILGGCASTMSGFDGGSQFACKAPDGVTCSSLSGVYANAVANNLPALRKDGMGDAKGIPRTGEVVGERPYSAVKITLLVLAILLFIGILVAIAAANK